MTRRLVILSCSKRKRRAAGPLAAIERYDGPAFKVLRSFLRDNPDAARHLDIHILSARYGLIPSTREIPDYDYPITVQRALELQDEVQGRFSQICAAEYSDVCIALSAMYLAALGSWNKLAPSRSNVTLAGGGFGTRLARLKAWLTGVCSNRSAIPAETTQLSGLVRFHGIDLCFKQDLLPSHIKQILSRHPREFRLRNWYVEVDGIRLPPKWLVSQLTGVHVSRFSARDARRVLRRLGIETHAVMEVPREI